MMAMSTETTTLMGREEKIGSPYPLWMERLLLVVGVVVFIAFREDVLATIDHPLAGVIVTYVVFPLVLLASVEVLGRIIQGFLPS